MNLKFIYKFFALCLLAVSGQSWATMSDMELNNLNKNPIWNDISSIKWSTDGGATWGNSALMVEQAVKFKFTLYKELDGKHFADFLKVWIDWDGNGNLSDFASDKAQVLLFDYHEVNKTEVANTSSGIEDTVHYYNFISDPVKISADMVGDHFMLARVTCSESLLEGHPDNTTWGYQWTYANSTKVGEGIAGYNNLFMATKSYYQGESKLVKLHVDPSKVPEPGTLALLAVGFAGFGFCRRRAARP